jgi:membrane-associated phospholipid phosphatase
VSNDDHGGAAHRSATEGTATGGSTPRVARPLLLTHGIWQPRSLVRFAVAGAVMAALWTVVGLLLVRYGPPALDLTALEAAVDRQSPTLVSWARFASWVGDLPVVSAVTIVVVAIAYWRSRRWDLGWLSLAVIGGALAVTATIKLLTDRLRPDGGLTDTFSSAFPSGHAVRAAAVYTLVAWLVLRWTSPHRRALRAASVATAVTMILAIGVSRLLLAAHWLSDVVGGYLLGILWVAVCVAVTRPHRVGRAEVTSAAAGSGAGVDDQRQDGPDAVPSPQEPGGDRQGPARPADGVDQQHRSGR